MDSILDCRRTQNLACHTWSETDERGLATCDRRGPFHQHRDQTVRGWRAALEAAGLERTALSPRSAAERRRCEL